MRQSNLFTWREHRVTTVMYSQLPIFCNTNTTETPTYRHHVSMYGITEEEAAYQKKIGNTKNRKVEHYSSELVIDTDDEKTAQEVWDKLCDDNYYFELWKLNNYKFFLKRGSNDKPSPEMCYQDRQFIRNLFFKDNKKIFSTSSDIGYPNYHYLDTSIYSSPFHLIRAKNSIHEVTNAKSVLVDVYKGSKLVETNHIECLSIVKNNPENLKFDINVSDWEKFQYFINLAQGEGPNKHTIIWKVAKDISKILSFNTGLELILVYAKSIGYCEEKASRAFKQGYEAARC